MSFQGEEDIIVSDTTRALIKSLPGLFSKHQTDEARIAVVLSVPLLMNLDLYVEMRMTAVSPSVGIIFVMLTCLAGLHRSMG
jgi:cohesin complex subunit SA-1/2